MYLCSIISTHGSHNSAVFPEMLIHEPSTHMLLFPYTNEVYWGSNAPLKSTCFKMKLTCSLTSFSCLSSSLHSVSLSPFVSFSYYSSYSYYSLSDTSSSSTSHFDRDISTYSSLGFLLSMESKYSDPSSSEYS